ncbi:MAG TPA: AraC family transcriptional regulator [Ktedonosporobacter sp.]|nr:AraC family transcriptional regulator [Ktedonosporobacter sp.]
MAITMENDPGRTRYQVFKRNTGPLHFQHMQKDPFALDRLDIRFQWGRYGIQVLRCHLVAFDAATTIPAHKHREYEFHFIAWGQGSVTLDDGTFPLQAGMFYLTGPQVMHRQDIDAWDPMNELCLHVDIVELDNQSVPDLSKDHSWGRQPEILEADECVRQLNTMPAHPTLDQYDAMDWFLTAFSAWYDRESGAYSTIRQSIIQILLRAARAHALTQIHTALPSRDMNAYRYQLATQYIRDNYARAITLEEVAGEVHICGRQLQRIMTEQSNETFSAYLERYRLSQVCLSLMHTDLTVEQVAVQHGFSNGSYLHYVFKKRIGQTPLRYREQQRPAKSVDPPPV